MILNNLFATAEISQIVMAMGLELDPGNTFGYYSPQVDGSYFLNLYQEEDPEWADGLTDNDTPAALWSQVMNFLVPQIDGMADNRIILRKTNCAFLLQKYNGTFWENFSDGSNEDCVLKLIEIIKNK